MRSLMAIAALALSAAACGRATDPLDQEGGIQHVAAGDTVWLRYGEAVLLGSGGARIVFRRVEQDSRCPIDVTCVWAGDAQVRLDASEAPGISRQIDLHTTLEPQETHFAGFRVRLIEVAPARTDQDDVGPEDYSIRLAISRG